MVKPVQRDNADRPLTNLLLESFMAKPILTHERLLELLHYDKLSGDFTALVKRGNLRVGDVAGTLNQGYVRIAIDGRIYEAHRLAWFYVRGVWPTVEIDHKDNTRDHNWFTNLREATGAQNRQNQTRPRSDKKSCGVLGVTYDAKKRRYYPAIKVNGKSLHLGSYKTLGEAQAVYLEAKERLHPFFHIADGLDF